MNTNTDSRITRSSCKAMQLTTASVPKMKRSQKPTVHKIKNGSSKTKIDKNAPKTKVKTKPTQKKKLPIPSTPPKKKKVYVPEGPFPKQSNGTLNFFDSSPTAVASRRKKMRWMNEIFEEIEKNPPNVAMLLLSAAEVNGKYLGHRSRRADIWNYLEKRGWKCLKFSIDKRLMIPIKQEVDICTQKMTENKVGWQPFEHSPGVSYLKLPLIPTESFGRSRGFDCPLLHGVIKTWLTDAFPNHKFSQPYLFRCKSRCSLFVYSQQCPCLLTIILFFLLCSLFLTF